VEEIRDAIAKEGNCTQEEICTGEIRRGPLNTVWARCPLGAARILAEKSKIRVGWTLATVEALDVRPMRCFRCWELGRVAESCTSDIDRSGMCYRCGSTSHRVREYTASPKCSVCADLNRRSNHLCELGTRLCTKNVFNT